MSLAAKVLSACGGAEEKIFVDDVFSAYTYPGNSSTQTINNGVDLAGKGGMVWIKNRIAISSHWLCDTSNGATFSSAKYHYTNSTAALANAANILNVNANGFSWGTSANGTSINNVGNQYVSWTFRKAPKFFDVVTYTGNGANRTISHALGSVPGMIMVKRTDTLGSWMLYHNSIANTENLVMDTTAAKVTNATAWNSTTATASVFSLGTHADVNTNTGTYVVYLFAHDSSADGIVQCGGYTSANGTNNYTTVTLGWEPQYVMVKSTAISADWAIYDMSRGMPLAPSYGRQIYANSSAAELQAGIQGNVTPTATGFMIRSGESSTGDPTPTGYVYLAIRRPNKPPTSGTQVYNAIARTGTGAAATVTGVGFAPDLSINFQRAGGRFPGWRDRLRGANLRLGSYGTGAEVTETAAITSFAMDGVVLGADSGGAGVNGSGESISNWFFKRAPGIFDIVCYTGTGVAHTEAHNLGVVPELIIFKNRNTTYNWPVVVPGTINYLSTFLNLTNSQTTYTYAANAFLSAAPTNALLHLSGGSALVNASANTHIAYLFATKAGISKVFSFTGDGNQGKLIDCGFTTGSRFILIKRTDAAGDWFVFDTARTYPAGNDPHLSLNTTAAEVTSSDDVDYHASGFLVNQNVTTNLNVLNNTYIGLSFA